MNHSYQTDRPSRRGILISGTSLWFLGMSLSSPVLLSGCGTDNSQVSRVENTESPADKAKDSMDYYRQSKLKGGGGKSGAPSEKK